MERYYVLKFTSEARDRMVTRLRLAPGAIVQDPTVSPLAERLDHVAGDESLLDVGTSALRRWYFSAFNLPIDARPAGANQYGKRYTFPDASTLRIDAYHDRIEWRRFRNGPGAVRGLFYRCMGKHRERELQGLDAGTEGGDDS